MKKIAIFSGGGPSGAARLAESLAASGRAAVDLMVVPEGAAVMTSDALAPLGVTVVEQQLPLTDEAAASLASTLRERGIELICLDSFPAPVPSGVADAVEGLVVELPADSAARRVEEALGLPPELPPDVVAEWAETLKVPYDPAVAQTPPPVPGAEGGQNPAPGMPGRQAGGVGPAEPMPPTWLLWAVLSAVFCCTVAGIVAIVFSALVSSRYFAGDYAGARRASHTAEIWIIVSIVLGVISAVAYIPLMLIS